MTKTDDKPKLRNDLQIIPVVVQGQQGFLVRDSLGLLQGQVVLTPAAIALAQLLDGTRSVDDMALELTRAQDGTIVSSDLVASMIKQLDDMFLLDNDKYRNARRTAINEYSALTSRSPVGPGQAYPGDPSELAEYLDRVLDNTTHETTVRHEDITAVIAPHIDPASGDKAYGAAYSLLRGMQPDLVIIFGTGHGMEDGLFCFTEKDFEMPFGVIQTDRGLVTRLRNAAGPAAAPNDIPHRSEHSIEFQLLYLQHVFSGKSFRIVPILCGSFHEHLSSVAGPSDIPEAKAVLDCLRDIMQSSSERVLVVAGVDLSHIGSKFGHDRSAREIVCEAREHDQALLKAVENGSVTDFWAEGARVNNRYNVCGFPVLACMLEVLPGNRGMLLEYDISHETETESAVSFASVVMYRSHTPDTGGA